MFLARTSSSSMTSSCAMTSAFSRGGDRQRDHHARARAVAREQVDRAAPLGQRAARQRQPDAQAAALGAEERSEQRLPHLLAHARSLVVDRDVQVALLLLPADR